jgi:hypothetical protein
VAARTYCRCEAAVGTEVVDGGLILCSACGCVRPDPLILAVFREQRRISQQQETMLEAIERLERGGDYSEHEQRVEETAASPNKLLTPAELAQELGRSRDFIYDHADELGVSRVGDGPQPRLYFDLKRARERLASLATTNGSQPRVPERRTRRLKRRTASVELLPVKERSVA